MDLARFHFQLPLKIILALKLAGKMYGLSIPNNRLVVKVITDNHIDPLCFLHHRLSAFSLLRDIALSEKAIC